MSELAAKVRAAQRSRPLEAPLPTTVPADAAAAPPALRPLSPGEILDRALQLFRSSFFALFGLALVFQAPAYAAARLFESLLQEKAPVLTRPGAFRGELPTPDQLLWLAGGALAYLAVALALYQLAAAALTSAAGRAFLGERIEVKSALKDALARSPQVLGTSLLVFLWSGLLVALSSLPGLAIAMASFWLGSPAARVAVLIGGLAVAGLAVLAAGLWLVLTYALSSEVVIIERLSFVSAIRRSARLMSGSLGPTFFDNCKVRASLVHAVNLCIGVSIAVVSSLPTLLVSAAYGASPLAPETYDPVRVPLWAVIPAELFQVLVQAAAMPYGMLAVIVFYFDLRIRKEGFDLELLAGRLGSGSSRRLAAGWAALLALGGGAARAESPAALQAACASLAQRAQALPTAKADADLSAGALAVLREARLLTGQEVRGVRLQLPWLADLEAELGPGRPRPALEAAAQKLAGRLFFTCGVMGEDPTPPVAVDRARLVAILSRPEYQRRSPDDTLLYQLFTRAAAWLRDLFTANEGLQATAISVRALFLLGACLFAIFLALRMARTALGRRRPRPQRAQPVTLAAGDPENYRSRAAEALAAGDGREALRLGLLTLLATLERLRLSSPGRSATNRELAEQIAARGGTAALSQRAQELLGLYDRVWYGLRPVSREEAHAFVDQAFELCARAAAERGAP